MSFTDSQFSLFTYIVSKLLLHKCQNTEDSSFTAVKADNAVALVHTAVKLEAIMLKNTEILLY